MLKFELMHIEIDPGPISRRDWSLASYHFVLDLVQEQTVIEIKPDSYFEPNFVVLTCKSFEYGSWENFNVNIIENGDVSWTFIGNFSLKYNLKEIC